jgi:hypothetical protein
MEALVLDPFEVSLNRVEFDITAYVAEAGPDFGEAAIEQYLADVQQGQLPVDFRYPSRTVTIPLLLRDDPAHTFEELRAYFQQKAGLFQREGGWVKRQTVKGPLFGDVTGASLKLGGSTAQALWGIDADAVLTLTTLPDWYGIEVIDSIRSNAADATELIYTLDGVNGEISARSRLVLKNLSASDIHGLLWGVRSRNYSPDPTARLVYEARNLTPIAPAVDTANAKAFSGGREIRIDATSTNWTAVLSTDIAGVGSLTHGGSYQVWARVRTGGVALGRAHKVRFVWDVGDLLLPVENPPVRMPLDSDYWLADLGTVRLDPSPIGTHRWQGVVQAADGRGDFAVDKLWLQPLDEAAGRLTIPPSASVGITGYSARDEFPFTTGGSVPTTQALPIGGSWTFSHGDSDDFLTDAAGRVARSTISDTAARFLYASGPTLAATAVQIDFYIPNALAGSAQPFLMFRRVDVGNYAYATTARHPTDGSYRLYLSSALGAPPVTIAESDLLPWHFGNWWSLRVAVTTSGYIFAWLFPQGAVPPAEPTAMRYDPDKFGPGKTLAAGKVGFGDYNPSATAGARLYDNFLAWVPDVDAVMFAGRSAELRYDGMYREAPGGTNYAPMSTVLGDLLRLPPAGLENRTTEIFLKPSFGDLDQSSDPMQLRLQAEMRHRASYLFVPED